MKLSLNVNAGLFALAIKGHLDNVESLENKVYALMNVLAYSAATAHMRTMESTAAKEDDLYSHLTDENKHIYDERIRLSLLFLEKFQYGHSNDSAKNLLNLFVRKGPSDAFHLITSHITGIIESFFSKSTQAITFYTYWKELVELAVDDVVHIDNDVHETVYNSGYFNRSDLNTMHDTLLIAYENFNKKYNIDPHDDSMIKPSVHAPA